jgi:hypothetical protein
MASFTVRVELHRASGDHYDELHDGMEKHGYSREITTDRGTWRLPTAEYNLEGSSMNATEVRDQALEIAMGVKASPKPWVFVTEAKERAWSSEKV